MDDSERIAKFEADFGRLKRNREQVPLEKLKTTYAKRYNALVAEVTAGADWFAGKCLELLAGFLPRHPRDTAGNEWLEKRIAAIAAEEARPGGLVERRMAALLDRLDMDEFRDLIYRQYARYEREAFDPYWQRHNRWVGPPDNRWIFNDIIASFWLSPGTDPSWPEGAWINTKREVYTTNWPPAIGEDNGGKS